MPQSRRRQSSSSQSSNGRNQAEEKQAEADRYRRAAEDALQQLDWAIGYLHGIKKTEISKALARNRSYIRQNLMGLAEQPVPTQQTEQT